MKQVVPKNLKRVGKTFNFKIMKTKLFLISMILFFGAAIFVGCNKQEDSASFPNLNMKKYTQLSSIISTHLNQIAENLRSENSNFTEQAAVIESAKKVFGTDDQEYSSFLDSYNKTIILQQLKLKEKVKACTIPDSIWNKLSSEQQIIIRNIFDSLTNSSNLDNFTNYLEKQYSDIPNDNKLTNNEKDFMLSYLTGYIASINFIENNIDLVKSSTQFIGFKNTLNWWSSWGKCAAGIVGGAIIGGLTGAAAASVIPGLGTTAGCIIGGIGGGLSGAAAAC